MVAAAGTSMANHLAMAAIIEAGRLEWGIQLPIQSLSTRVSMEWEREGGTVDVDSLETLCREHLAPYKVPARFETLDAAPE